MNRKVSLLSLITIPSLLFVAPQISIASTNLQTTKVENQPSQLAQAHKAQVYQERLVQGIIFTLIDQGELEQALDLIKREKIGENESASLRGLIAFDAAQTGKFNLALQVASSFQDEDARNSILAQIAVFLAEAGKTERALQIVQGLPGEFEAKGITQLEIVRHLVAQGEVDQALKVAQTIKNKQSQAVALTEAGAVEEALEVAQTSEILAKIETLGLIADALGRMGQFDQALNLAQSLPKSSFQGFTLFKIVHSLVRAEQWEQALQVTQLIQDDYGHSRENVGREIPWEHLFPISVVMLYLVLFWV